MQIRFSAIQLVYDKALDAKSRRPLQLTPETGGSSSQQGVRHSVWLKGDADRAGDLQMGWAWQPQNSKVDVTFYETKSGFYGIATQGTLKYIALPGSRMEVGDTTVFIPGRTIEGSVSAPVVPVNPSRKPQRVTDQAMILGAGLATRFEPVSGDTTGLPKPGVPIAGNDSIIVAIAKQLKAHGFKRVIVNTFYMPQQIKQQLSKIKGLQFTFIDETKPSGTAGGLVKALNQGVVNTKKPIFIIQGDAVTNADLSKLLNQHQRKNPKGISVGLMPVADEDLSKYGIVSTMPQANAKGDASGFTRRFIEKPKTKAEADGSNLGSTGFYVISNALFEQFRKTGNAMLYPDAPSDAAPQQLEQREAQGAFDYAMNFITPLGTPKPEQIEGKAPWPTRVWGQVLSGYWRDVGNPVEYFKTVIDVARGMLNRDGKVPKTVANAWDKGVIYWPGTKTEAKRQKARLQGNIIVTKAPGEVKS